MSILVDIADALVADLNGHEFTQAFTAVRRYLPHYTLEELATLRVTVVPVSISESLADRSRVRGEYTMEVGVEKKIAQEADVDSLLALLEEITDHVRMGRLALAGGETAFWIRTEVEPAFAPEHLEELRAFTGVIAATYRVVR